MTNIIKDKYQYTLSNEELCVLYKYQDLLDDYYENVHFISQDNKLLQKIGGNLVEITPRRYFNISTKNNTEQSFVINDILNNDIKLMAITGHAGTGKSFIALLGALKLRKDYVFNVLYTREIYQVGKEMGFLPGGIEDKFLPFMYPFYDSVDSIIKFNKKSSTIEYLEKFKKEAILTPIQFMRGRSLDNTIIILDEAQNCDLNTLQTVISRAGKNSKVILCGSMHQVDNKSFSGCTDFELVIERFSGQKCFSHVELVKDERSDLARLADELLGAS